MFISVKSTMGGRIYINTDYIVTIGSTFLEHAIPEEARKFYVLETSRGEKIIIDESEGNRILSIIKVY